jgi:hypothetical protein
MDSLALFSQQQGAAAAAALLGGIFALFLGCFCITTLALLAGLWRVFDKAGYPGWAAIVPIYNGLVLLRITGYPDWLLIFQLLPGIVDVFARIAPALGLFWTGLALVGGLGGLVVWILICFELARRFDQGAGFAIGLILLGFIFFPILGYGSAEYQGGGRRRPARRRRRVRPDYDEDEDYEEEPRPRPRRKPVAREEDNEAEPEEPPPAPRAPLRSDAPQAQAGAVVRCVQCPAHLRIPDNLPPGKKVKCPKCGAIFAPRS